MLKGYLLNMLGCLNLIVLYFPFFVSVFDCAHIVCLTLMLTCYRAHLLFHLSEFHRVWICG